LLCLYHRHPHSGWNSDSNTSASVVSTTGPPISPSKFLFSTIVVLRGPSVLLPVRCCSFADQCDRPDRIGQAAKPRYHRSDHPQIRTPGTTRWMIEEPSQGARLYSASALHQKREYDGIPEPAHSTAACLSLQSPYRCFSVLTASVEMIAASQTPLLCSAILDSNIAQ